MALAVCGFPRGKDSAPRPYRNTAKDQGPCLISFLLQLQYVTLCIQKRLGASPGRQSTSPDICPSARVTVQLPQQPSQWLWFGRLAKALLNVHRIFICRLRFGLGCFFFSVQFDICIVAILRETLSPHHKQALGTGSPGCQRYFHSFLAFVLVLQPRLCSPSAGTCSPIGGKLLNTKMNKKETTNRKKKKTENFQC